MTKEQIEKKAKEIASKIEERLMETTTIPRGEIEIRGDYAEEAAAMEMAEWILSHQWVSVEDELPQQKERYSKYVIMRNRIGGHYIGCYDFVAELWLDGNLEMIYMDVTHWMPIPPLAEEGDNDE